MRRSSRRSSTICVTHGRVGLPEGVIHADLFPDNVFFLRDELSGLIDFYFACNDLFAYDLAICLNAWCFEPDNSFNVTKGRALIQAYEDVRPLWPRRARGASGAGARGGAALPADAALRLADRAERRARHAQGPARISAQAALPPAGRKRRRLWAPLNEGRCEARGDPHRRRLLRQSRAGRLGRHPGVQRAREGAFRRRAGDHQQPHGADRGHRGAARAEGPLRRSSSTPIPSICATASPNGSTAGSGTAGAPPTRSR